MKVCITGGLGYLGSVLTKKLIENGYDVSIIDCKIYGNFLPREVLERVKICYEDIRELNNGIGLIKNSDVIIHLAGIVGDPACDLIKEKAVDINLNGTKKIIKAAEKFNKKVIYASTCSVYGAQKGLITEKSKVLPLSIYALSKYAAENLFKESKVDYLIFRMGTLFGYSPRMRIDLVVNTFIVKALLERKITVFGGEQWRPFLHLDDASNFYLKALELPSLGRKILNIGGINLRIIDLAHIIKNNLDCEVKVVREIKDPRNYKVDSSLAKKILRMDFKKNINDAIKEIKEAFENGRFNPNSPTLSNFEWLKLSLKEEKY